MSKFPPSEVIMLVPISGSSASWLPIYVSSDEVLHCVLESVFSTIGLNGAATNEGVVNVSEIDHKEANKLVVS